MEKNDNIFLPSWGQRFFLKANLNVPEHDIFSYQILKLNDYVDELTQNTFLIYSTTDDVIFEHSSLHILAVFFYTGLIL